MPVASWSTQVIYADLSGSRGPSRKSYLALNSEICCTEVESSLIEMLAHVGSSGGVLSEEVGVSGEKGGVGGEKEDVDRDERDVKSRA